MMAEMTYAEQCMKIALLTESGIVLNGGELTLTEGKVVEAVRECQRLLKEGDEAGFWYYMLGPEVREIVLSTVAETMTYFMFGLNCTGFRKLTQLPCILSSLRDASRKQKYFAAQNDDKSTPIGLSSSSAMSYSISSRVKYSSSCL